MLSIALTFLLGASCLLFLQQLPSITLLITSIAALILLRFCILKIFNSRLYGNNKYLTAKHPLTLTIIFLTGLSWATFTANQILKHTLPPQLENQPLIITGTIDSIPEQKDTQTNFIFQTRQITPKQTPSEGWRVGGFPATRSLRVGRGEPHAANAITGSDGRTFMRSRIAQHESAATEPRATDLPERILIRIRLTWYFPPHDLQAGQTWQLHVKLKKPKTISTPGAFDYPQWLFEQHITTTGYIQNKKNNLLLTNPKHTKWLDRYRATIASNILENLTGKPLTGLIQALAVGIRDQITEEQWAVLRGTGTNHLFAIAGLHIGFISGFIYFIISFIWRRLGKLPLYLPTPIASVIAALTAAIIYSALAGFSLPTQRAIIMTSVFLLATLCRRKVPLWHSWSLALLLVLIYDPLAVLSASFWMSFSAVAFIIYGISGRLHKKSVWRHWLQPQWVIAIGLIPISLLFFQQVALANFIANAIAIPWIGFLVLPLSLLGSQIEIISPLLSKIILIGAEKLLEIIWPILTAITNAHWLQWHMDINNPFIFITAVIAVLLILMPRGIPGRWLSIIYALPLFFGRFPQPGMHELWLTFLNSNPGTVAIIRTHTHTLVYESAIKPAINNSIVLPYLQQAGIKQIDQLMINSVNDNEEIFNLLQLMPVRQIIINKTNNAVQGQVTICNQTINWQWDTINFNVTSEYNRKNQPVCSLLVKKNNLTALIINGIDNSVQQNNDLVITTQNQKEGRHIWN